jgi:PhnB protein
VAAIVAAVALATAIGWTGREHLSDVVIVHHARAFEKKFVACRSRPVPCVFLSTRPWSTPAVSKEVIMARVSTYLNFNGKTEAAFNFYSSVFGTEFVAPIQRMGAAPAAPGMPQLSDKEKNYVMHVALPILGGHVIMGTDTLESAGHKLTVGTNVSINLQPDTRKETENLFAKLSDGGKVGMPLSDMFWGDYFGHLEDKFGVQWMFNCSEKKK